MSLDKGWSDRTSRKAPRAQGCALGAAPPARLVQKVAQPVADPPGRQSVLVTFALFKSNSVRGMRRNTAGMPCQSGTSMSDSKSRLKAGLQPLGAWDAPKHGRDATPERREPTRFEKPPKGWTPARSVRVKLSQIKLNKLLTLAPHNPGKFDRE